MPDPTRDPCRLLRCPAEGGVGGPGSAPAGPQNNVFDSTPSGLPSAQPQGQCVAEAVTSVVSSVLGNLGNVVEAAVTGAAKGGAAGAGRGAIGEGVQLGVGGLRDALNSEACETAIAENADRANSLGLGAIVAP